MISNNQMNRLKDNKINKQDLIKLKEDDIMFITNPGRMGDEDGSTFVVKQKEKYIIYRVEGWMYRNKNLKEEEFISLEDIEKQFPKWIKSWKNADNKDYKGKYKYLYMGFGNGLCVDYSIYDEFEPYLKRQIESYLENKKEEEKESLKYAATFNVWKKAAKQMIKEKEEKKQSNRE